MTRVAIYARYSSDLQNPRSVEDQVRDCEALALRNKWHIVAHYSDEAVSGTTMFRPGIQELMKSAALGTFDVVIAEALDRVSRNQGDSEKLREVLAFRDIKIVTISEGEITPMHTAFKGLMNSQFVVELGHKIRRGQRGSVANGQIPGGLCYGYKVVRKFDDEGEPIRGLREIDADEAAIVERIHREYADGKATIDIATQLNQERVPSPSGRTWSVSSIQGNRKRMEGILRNPVYIGRVAYNRQRMVKDPSTGKRVTRVNEASAITWGEMPHLRIVPQDLWDRVQHRLASTPTGGARDTRNQRPKHLLSGLTKCGHCGGSYIIVSEKYLGCSNRWNSGTCQNGRTIACDKVENAVVGAVQTFMLGDEQEARFIKRYHENRQRREEARQRARRNGEARMAEIEAKVRGVVDAIEAGGRTAAPLIARLDELERERQDLQAELNMTVPPPIKMIPNLRGRFAGKIAAMAKDLTRDAESRSRAILALRTAITKVVLTPMAERGHFEIEILGDEVGVMMLALGEAKPTAALHTARMVAEEGLEPPTPGL